MKFVVPVIVLVFSCGLETIVGILLAHKLATAIFTVVAIVFANEVKSCQPSKSSRKWNVSRI